MNRTRYAVVAGVAVVVLLLTLLAEGTTGGGELVALTVPAAQFFCGWCVCWWRLYAALAYTAIVIAAFLLMAVLVPDYRDLLPIPPIVLVKAAGFLLLPWAIGRGVRLIWNIGQLPSV